MISYDPYSGLEILPPVGDELKCRAALLQTIHAILDSSAPFYVEPNRDISLSYPFDLSVDDFNIYMEEGYTLYEHNGNHRYRRLPNGQLTERLTIDEIDYASEMDITTLRRYENKFSHLSVIGLDTNKNIYVIHRSQPHWIHVYSPIKKPLAKFRLLGGPTLRYLSADNCFCVITDNGGMEKKWGKNLLRVYRLELPKQNAND